MKELTIYEAKSKRQHLENLLELKKQQIELEFEKTQPSAKELKQISVSGGGLRVDRFAKYVEMESELDKEMVLIQKEIKLLDIYIEKELERLNEYDEWEQKVIYMRESGIHWFKIACTVPFSERTCKRIYRKYKNKRNV